MENKLFRKNFAIGIIILFIGTSIVPSIGGELSNFYATQDIEVSHGTIINDYTYTQDSDNQYEGITERESGGKPSKRYSYLEHKWTISVGDGYNDYTFYFYLEAYHTANDEGDDFVFAYSTNDGTYTDMVTVTKTNDDDIYQTFEFLEALSGTIYIRVKDMDQTSGNRFRDTIYVDHMYIEATTESEPDTTPPVIFDVAATDHDNTWCKMNPSMVGGTLNVRERFDMVYDSDADRTIAFGGSRPVGELLNDTWVYNFTDNTWYNRSPATKYGTLWGRADFAMAYDSDNKRAIMFGGNRILGEDYTDTNETWIYNFTDNTWYNMSPATEYGTLRPTRYPEMVYDSSAKVAIMFGGYAGGAFSNETWVYNFTDNTWYNRSPATEYGTLNGTLLHSMVYDSSADKTIMFGGSMPGAENQYTNETWVYDFTDNTWYKRNPETTGGTLTQRIWHEMVYDSSADRTIMFGGQKSGGNQINDTWVYNFTDDKWCKANPSWVGGTLWPREAPGMVYDNHSKRTILFAGFYGVHVGDEYKNDTWIYNIDDTTATITWTTDEPSDSVVNYGTTTALGNTTSNSNMITSHSIMLTDLLPNTTYYFEVQSTDASNNTATDNNNGSYYTFPDTTAPVISNVATSDITDSSATITWTTDEPSDSVVNYGTTTALGNTESDPALVINHEIILSELTENTTYYYEVQSTDEGGYTATDDNGGAYYMFTTLIDAPPIISDVTATDITDSSATITWTTNEPSDSVVNYGTTTALGNTTSNSNMVTSHSIMLTDLLPNTTYYFEVQSTDASENTATDNNNGSYYTFITAEAPPINVMHVQRIDMWYEKTGINYMIYTKVLIVDSIGGDVEGATVYIETDLPGGSTHTDNGVTGSDGTVTFSYGKTKVTGTYTSTVTNVVKDGWTYDPSENLETSESLEVP